MYQLNFLISILLKINFLTFDAIIYYLMQQSRVLLDKSFFEKKYKNSIVYGTFSFKILFILRQLETTLFFF